jgi:hypothetical protein
MHTSSRQIKYHHSTSVLVIFQSHQWLITLDSVGNLAKLTSNLIQEIENNSISEANFMNIFDLAEYANM